MLWAYIAFSQYLIIYSGNLVEEIPYYVARTSHGWQYLAVALVVFHFAAPFSLLLSRDLKRSATRLVIVALAILVMRLVDILFLVSPDFAASGVNLHLADGAEIIFSDNLEDYLPVVFVRVGGIELYNYSPLIYARDCSNVAVTGKGKLNGNAKKWWAWKSSETTLIDLIACGTIWYSSNRSRIAAPWPTSRSSEATTSCGPPPSRAAPGSA